MREDITFEELKMAIYRTPTSNRICYINWPEGLNNDLERWLDSVNETIGITIVIITGLNWNDNLTPWPAEGVFKKGKPFGGKAEDYRCILENTIIPMVEKNQVSDNIQRTILGVSLSGLFAIWCGLSSDKFEQIGSISGSLWYDNFTVWIKTTGHSPSVKKIFMTLGDREKNSKNVRMAKVEDETITIAKHLSESGYTVDYSLFDGTHFSPIIPRLEMAFNSLF